MSGKFEGKVAAVTGGASGIGAAIIRQLHREGAKLVSLDLQAPIYDDLSEKCLYLQGDVTVEADVERLVNTAVEQYGRLDIMVNNAGGSRSSSVLDMTTEEFDYTFKLNMYGVMYGVKYAGRQMRKQGGGSIVNVTSQASVVPGAWMGSYCAAKAGINQYVQVAALELGPFGIRVNAVGPGFTRTPLISAYTGDPEVVDEVNIKTPLRRFAEPDDIASYVVFLAGDESTFITGTTLIIDGGQFLEGYPNAMDIFMKKMGFPYPFPETVKQL